MRTIVSVTMALALVAGMLLTTPALTPVLADEPTPEELQAEKDELTGEIENLEDTIDTTNNEIAELQDEIAELEDKETPEDVVDDLGGPDRDDYENEDDWLTDVLIWILGRPQADLDRWNEAVENQNKLIDKQDQLETLQDALAIYQARLQEKQARKEALCDLLDDGDGDGDDGDEGGE